MTCVSARFSPLPALAGALLVLGIAGCTEEAPKPPEIRAVTTLRVSVGTQSDNVAYSGDVQPRYETALGFRVGGKVVARLVDVGTRISAGQVLARLDPEDQQLNQEAARSQLAAAKAAFEQAKADLARYAELLEKQFISAAEFDRRRTDYDVAKARLEQAEAQLGVTRNQSAYTQLRADHAGVVTSVRAEVGQVVSAGQTVLTVARTGQKEVEINVPENKLGELNAAKTIAVTLWAAPDKVYRGEVREVSPTADAVTRTYAVRVAVLDADAAMKLGMTANVYLRGVGRGRLVELPATAVFKQGGGAAVWVVDPDSLQVRSVAVEVARYHEDKVSVSAGLSGGELVVRAGVHKLFEGEKVRVLEETGA
jgi:membrane fusion protein, multidrug efflux system